MKTLDIVTILCLSLLCLSYFQFVESDPNFDGRFSTKTSYFSVANENTDEIKIDGCSAKQFWLLVRHGTRNPGDDDILDMQTRGKEIQQSIIKNHEEGKGSLSDDDLEGIKAWTFNLTVEDEDLLTEAGRLELKQLGERYKKRLPSLINLSAKVVTSSKSRTIESAKSFLEGALPSGKIPIGGPNDTFLRYYKYCPTWTSEVEENPETYEEQKKFETSSHVLDAIKRVNDRLGFSSADTPSNDRRNEEETLSFEDLELIYDICRFETAWNQNEESSWCATLCHCDLKALEYYDDLEYYYVNGYGNELNGDMSCQFMKDLSETFEDGNQKGTFYFSHSDALLPFQSLLGLYDDDFDLTNDIYEAAENRTYRTSYIGTFAQNIGFVRFECDNDETKIITLHQEQKVALDVCDGEVECDWNKFKEAFKDEISCPWNDICGNGSPTQSKMNTLTLITLMMFIYSYLYN